MEALAIQDGFHMGKGFWAVERRIGAGSSVF
jgi:hypothetical protein